MWAAVQPVYKIENRDEHILREEINFAPPGAAVTGTLGSDRPVHERFYA